MLINQGSEEQRSLRNIQKEGIGVDEMATKCNRIGGDRKELVWEERRSDNERLTVETEWNENRKGQGMEWMGKAGQSRVGQESAGKGRAGRGRAWQERAGQGRCLSTGKTVDVMWLKS